MYTLVAIWLYIHIGGYFVLCIQWWLSGSMYILVTIWFYVHIGGYLVLYILVAIWFYVQNGDYLVLCIHTAGYLGCICLIQMACSIHGIC